MIEQRDGLYHELANRFCEIANILEGYAQQQRLDALRLIMKGGIGESGNTPEAVVADEALVREGLGAARELHISPGAVRTLLALTLKHRELMASKDGLLPFSLPFKEEMKTLIGGNTDEGF